MISIFIVDDEIEAVNGIKKLLASQSRAKIVGEALNGVEAIKGIRSHQPDVLFLDVQMPGISGFEVLKSLEKEQLPLVIFTTAHDKWAIEAFEQNAVDFLLKPFTNGRFEEAFERVVELHDYKEQGNIAEVLKRMVDKIALNSPTEDKLIPHLAEAGNRMLVFKCDGRIQFTGHEDILYFESFDNYIKIHSLDGVFIIRKPLNSILESVSEDEFVRVHRKYVVNIHNIKFLDPLGGGDYEVSLKNGNVIRCSRSYKEDLFKRTGHIIN